MSQGNKTTEEQRFLLGWQLHSYQGTIISFIPCRSPLRDPQRIFPRIFLLNCMLTRYSWEFPLSRFHYFVLLQTWTLRLKEVRKLPFPTWSQTEGSDPISGATSNSTSDWRREVGWAEALNKLAGQLNHFPKLLFLTPPLAIGLPLHI